MNTTSLHLIRSENPENTNSVAGTGLNPNNLMKLILKNFYVRGVDNARDVTDSIKLHIAIVKELLDTAKNQNLIEILGSGEGYAEFRYGLTAKGKQWAIDGLNQNQYVGPAPVTLDDFKRQVLRQSVTSAAVTRSDLLDRFTGLIVPETLERRLGPAMNSGRSLLLYGAPGNGKTTIAEAIAGAFGGTVLIPYCIEVDGEIIKVFDPIYHNQAEEGPPADGGQADGKVDRPEYTDRRWVVCKRPIVTVGGELTLDMLALNYSSISKFYEAPLQVKASGGIFIVDDLGRQLVSPKDLLNRWIIPMDKRIDFLALQNGTTFSVPFDNLLIFSTNLEPMDLMDPAFLRRIPYKVEVKYPTEEEYRQVFQNVCAERDLQISQDLLSFAMDEVRNTHEQPLAFYQPNFIVDQVIASCRYENRDIELNRELLDEAMQNISARTSDAVLTNGGSSARKVEA